MSTFPNATGWRARLPVRRVLWPVAGALLWSAGRFLGAFDADGCLRFLVGAVFVLWCGVSLLMLARWATGRPVVRTNVPIGGIAQVLPVTVIASEDGRFCYHRGVDFKELRERIALGTYTVDSDAVAAAILKRLLGGDQK